MLFAKFSCEEPADIRPAHTPARFAQPIVQLLIVEDSEDKSTRDSCRIVNGPLGKIRFFLDRCRAIYSSVKITYQTSSLHCSELESPWYGARRKKLLKYGIQYIWESLYRQNQNCNLGIYLKVPYPLETNVTQHRSLKVYQKSEKLCILNTVQRILYFTMNKKEFWRKFIIHISPLKKSQNHSFKHYYWFSLQQDSFSVYNFSL